MTTETTTEYTPQVGDIFVETWGYDQTNITYWEIVKVAAKTVSVLKIEQRFTGETRGTDDIVVPAPGEYSKTKQDWHIGADGYAVVTREVPAPSRKTIKVGYQGRPYFKATSYSSAYLWSGNPNRQTNPAFGH